MSLGCAYFHMLRRRSVRGTARVVTWRYPCHIALCLFSS